MIRPVHLPIFALVAIGSACTASAPGPLPAVVLDAGASGTDSGPATESVELNVEAPNQNAFLGSKPVRVSGTATGVDEVTVDGATVPVIDGRFSVNLTLPDGAHRVVIEADGHRQQRDFTVDTLAPVIELEPATVEGTRVVLSGRIVDSTATTLKINEATVPVDATGRFRSERFEAPGAYRYRFEATDSARHLTGDYQALTAGSLQPVGEYVSEAIGMKLGTEALSSLSEGAAAMVNDMSFTDTLRASNPVYSAWWGDVNLWSESHSGAEVYMVTEDGELTVLVTLHDLRVRGKIDTLSDVDTTISADSISLYAPLEISAVEGKFSISLGDSFVSMEGFSVAVGGLPSSITNWNVIRDTMQTKAEAALEEKLKTLVPDILSNALDGALPTQRVTVAGTSMDLWTYLQRVTLDETGLALDLAVATGPVAPLPGRHAAKYVSVGTMAPTGSTAPLALEVTLDLLNQAFTSAWASGAFQKHFASLNLPSGELATVGSVSVLRVLDPTVSEDAALSLNVDSVIVPVVTNVNGTLVLRAPDVHVAISAQSGSGAREIANLSVSFEAPIEITVVDGKMNVGVGDLAIMADLISSANPLPVRGAALDSLLTDLANSVGRDFLKMDGLSVPSLYGYQISLGAFNVVDKSIQAEGSLRYTPSR